MFAIFRLIKSVLSLNSRLTDDKLRQSNNGYSIDSRASGPETYITYSENGRKASIIADYSWYNDVVLYTDSFRRWTTPYGEELTEFEYQKVWNRAVSYLSCWGNVVLNEDSNCWDMDGLRRSLTEQGIEFVELDNGVIQYSIDADSEHFWENVKKFQGR